MYNSTKHKSIKSISKITPEMLAANRWLAVPIAKEPTELKVKNLVVWAALAYNQKTFPLRSQTELGEFLGIPRQTISPRVKALREYGLVATNDLRCIELEVWRPRTREPDKNRTFPYLIPSTACKISEQDLIILGFLSAYSSRASVSYVADTLGLDRNTVRKSLLTLEANPIRPDWVVPRPARKPKAARTERAEFQRWASSKGFSWQSHKALWDHKERLGDKIFWEKIANASDKNPKNFPGYVFKSMENETQHVSTQPAFILTDTPTVPTPTPTEPMNDDYDDFDPDPDYNHEDDQYLRSAETRLREASSS